MDRPRDPDPQQELKRRAILHEARRAFIADGYAATKIEPIARDAGVSTATLYALFDGKAELFAAVIEDAADDFTRQMDEVRTAEGDARQQLTSFALAYADFISDPFVLSVFRLVVAERPRFPAVAMSFFDKSREKFGALLMGMLNDLSASGALAPIDRPSWAAGQLMGMMEHPAFLVPLLTGDTVRTGRTNALVAQDAVTTFLARYGA